MDNQHLLHTLHTFFFKVIFKITMLCSAFVLPERRNNMSPCWAAYRKERGDPQCQQKRHGVSNSIRCTEDALINLTYRTPETNVLAVGCVFILFLLPPQVIFPRLWSTAWVCRLRSWTVLPLASVSLLCPPRTVWVGCWGGRGWPTTWTWNRSQYPLAFCLSSLSHVLTVSRRSVNIQSTGNLTCNCSIYNFLANR